MIHAHSPCPDCWRSHDPRCVQPPCPPPPPTSAHLSRAGPPLGPAPESVGGLFCRSLRHRPRLAQRLGRPRPGRLAGRPPDRPAAQTADGHQKKVSGWRGKDTQQLRRWIPRLRRAFRIQVHSSTLRRLARAAGYTWKRCWRSLRAQRDPAAFAASQARLRELHWAEARHEVAAGYVIESRFSRQAPYPMPGSAGASSRWNCRPCAVAADTPCWAFGRSTYPASTNRPTCGPEPARKPVCAGRH